MANQSLMPVVMERTDLARFPAIAERLEDDPAERAIVMQSAVEHILGWVAFYQDGDTLRVSDGDIKVERHVTAAAEALSSALKSYAKDNGYRTLAALNTRDRFSFGSFLLALGFDFEATLWRSDPRGPARADQSARSRPAPGTPLLRRKLDRLAKEKQITIRPVTKENWQGALSFDMLPEQYFLCSGAIYSLLESRFQDNLHCVLAYSRDVPFAFFMFERLPGRLIEIHRCFVAKSHQRGGLPKPALHEFLKFLRRDLGGTAAHLSVIPGNNRANRLFQALGARPRPVQDSEDRTEVQMAFDLTRFDPEPVGADD